MEKASDMKVNKEETKEDYRRGGRRGRGDRGRRPDRGESKRLTHFLAIPVDNETMLGSLEAVQNEIYDYYSDRIYEGWFMPPSRFHFR